MQYRLNVFVCVFANIVDTLTLNPNMIFLSKWLLFYMFVCRCPIDAGLLHSRQNLKQIKRMPEFNN